MTNKTKQIGKPLTSRDLAALIEVSQSAVSRAFTPGSSISPDLRERILKGARDYGYQPNAIASMLTTRRTNIVGIVVSDMQNPFYPLLIEKLTQGLQRVGLQSLLFNITPGASIEEQLVAIRTYNVDAVVVISATILNAKSLAWATEGRKALLLNRIGSDDIPAICIDNEVGARAIVDHLYDVGHRRVAYVAGLTKTGVGQARYSAFTARLAERGMRLAGTASREAYSYDAGQTCTRTLLQDKPDAIFFASDVLALGGLDALKEAGVAGQIGVVGFDDIPMAAWPAYSLTTYRQPVNDIVETAVRILTDATPASPKLNSLAGELIIRASSTPQRVIPE